MVDIQSGPWRIAKIETAKNKNNMTTISRRLGRKKGVATGLSANSPTSRNDMAGSDNSGNSNKNNAEIAGLFLAVAIILSLAGLAGPVDGGVGTSDETTSQSVAVMAKVIENTVPTTSTEVVAVTLGESIGGVIGAIFSVAINFVLRGGKVTDDSSSKSSDSETNTREKSGNKPSLLSQGLSDGDYFIANSASNSLLEAAGVPETIAKYSSVFIAAIPSQLVKIVPSLLEQNLSAPVRDPRKNISIIPSFWNKSNNKVVKPENFVPVAAGGAATSTTPVTIAAIDFVEVFADVTRWLEYE